MKPSSTAFLASLVLVAAFASTLFAQPPVKKFFPAEARSKLYSSGILVGSDFFVAGSGSALPGGGQPSTFSEQVRQCLANINTTLEMNGLGYANIVKLYVMLDDPNNFEPMNAVFREVFPENPPARTTLFINTIPQGNHIEITAFATADLSARKIIGTPPPGYPFSPAVLAGKTLYVSGKGDQLPGGGHPATFEEQARQCLKNVETTLSAAGVGCPNVVWTNVYLDDAANLKAFNKVYKEFFKKGSEPARANVIVNGLPGGSHVEVTVIATTDLASRKVVKSGGKKPGPKENYECASPAVWAGDMLYISAQYGGKGTLEEQIGQVMTSHVDILKKAGLGTKDIVSANVFLRDINDYGPLNKVYPDWFTEGRPGVRTCFMPYGGSEPNETLVRAYFFAARTKAE